MAPAGPVPEPKVAAALARCRGLGLEPVLAPAALRRHGYLAGPDEARAGDLNRGFRDEGIAAVWAIRGGYGSLRLLPRLDLSPLRRRPRPFIGFSDNTAVHLALRRAGVVSYHGPHAGAEHWPAETDDCFRRVLFLGGPPGLLPLPADEPPPAALVGGTAEGPLAGGNLTMLASACGTGYRLRCRGHILAIEDVNETPYRIDRALTQLLLAGALDDVAGIAFGRFENLRTGPADPPLAELLLDRIRPLGVPAALGFPIGHGRQNWTLPLGAAARLDADRGTLELPEPVVV